METKQRSQTDYLNQPADLIHTAGGSIHYVRKQVAYGLQGLVQQEEDIRQDGVHHPPPPERGTVTKRSFKRRRNSKPIRSTSEGNLALHGTADRLCLTQNLPTQGELRHVYLDMTWTRFGFRLQNYGRRSEEVQTIVQTVTAGSPAFMAGLHPGDCILEVNGQDMSSTSATDIVAAIMNTNGKRVQLLVKYINGVHCLELKKKLQLAQEKLKEKQKSLMKLLSTNRCPTSHGGVKFTDMPNTPQFNFIFNSECRESESDNETERDMLSALAGNKSELPLMSSCIDKRRYFSNVAVYTDQIYHISCDVLIVPFDSTSSSEIGQVIRLLEKGGDKLMNELALANQCQLGEFMMSSGGELKHIKHMFHCVFGHFEEHMKSCCLTALEKCLDKNVDTVTFWLDGFVSCHVPPTLFLENIKTILIDNTALLKSFRAVVFASQSIPDLAELVTHIFLN